MFDKKARLARRENRKKQPKGGKDRNDAEILKKNLESYQKTQTLLKNYESAQTIDRLKQTSLPYNNKKGKKKSGNRKLKKFKQLKLQSSKGEIRIIEVLKKTEIFFKIEKEFNDLINPKTGYKLRFDFYIPERKLCIEFDGLQHFEYTPDFHGKDINKGMYLLRQQQYRDSLKTKYCVEHGLRLLRIKFSEYDKIEEILTEEFNKKYGETIN